MKRNSLNRFYLPGTHYVGLPITGRKVVMCSKNNNGTINFASEPILGIATVKIPTFTRVVVPKNPHVEGQVRTSQVKIEKIEKIDGTIIDDEYICFCSDSPFNLTGYKAGLTVTSKNLDTDVNNNDGEGIDVLLMEKEEILKNIN